MNAACTPNGAAMRFVPGSGIILQISVLLPTFARHGRQCLPPDFSRPRRTRRRRLYGSTRLTVRANHGDGLIFPPQASRYSITSSAVASGAAGTLSDGLPPRCPTAAIDRPPPL
jgi:hypothetical protein